MRLRQDLGKAGRGLISAAKAIGTGMPLRDFCTDKKPVDETDLIGIYLVALTGIESPSGPLIPGGYDVSHRTVPPPRVSPEKR